MKTILVDAWSTFVTADGINREMHALLETLANPKLIVTNANEEEKVELGIVNMPYEVYSLAHNPNKTDPGYFLRLLADRGLSVADVVYFEHNPEAVRAARALGITTHEYDKDKRDLAALEAFLHDNA